MKTHAPGAPASYGGYEYQVETSVWFGLEYVLRLRRCEAIEIEPASGEDIEANLEVPEASALATVGLVVQRRRCSVQVKSRGAPWGKGELAHILYGGSAGDGARGPAPRSRPLALLVADSTLNFCLLTNAQAGDSLRSFVVREVGEASAATGIDIPAPSQGKPAPSVDSNVPSRIGIVEQLTADALRARTREILRTVGRVPPSKIEACVAELKDSVRLRLLGRSATTSFDLNEYLRLLRRHDGLPERSPAVAAFVPPSNFDLIRARLGGQHAVVIHGPPGTGKSLSAEVLAYEIQSKGVEPVDIVFATDADAARAAMRHSAPVLVVIDDPWGPHKSAPAVGAWTDCLPSILGDVCEDKRCIVVSRTGNFVEAIGDKSFHAYRPFVVELAKESYDVHARRAIVEGHLQSARAWHRDYARSHMTRILQALPTPFSLATFARSLRVIENEADARPEQLLADSATEAIARKVMGIIEPAQIPSMIVIWALLAVDLPLDDSVLRGVRSTLRRGGASGARIAEEVDAWQLVHILREGQWLPSTPARRPHPFVLDGLEQRMKASSAKTDDVLSALIEGWVAEDRLDLVSRLTDLVPTRTLPLPEAINSVIWRHFRKQLLEAAEGGFSAHLKRAAASHEQHDPVARTVRALIFTIGDGWNEKWQRPNWSLDELNRIRTCDDSRKVAERFLREELPRSGADYRDIVPFLTETLAWGVFQSFRDALAENVDDVRYPNREALVRGALSGPQPPYDEMGRWLQGLLQEVDAWFVEFGAGDYRAAEEREVDFAATTHLSELPSERYHGPREALALVTRIRREREGWRPIAALAHEVEFRAAWATAIAEDETTPTSEELNALARFKDVEAMAAATKRADCAFAMDELTAFIPTATHAELVSTLSALATMGTPSDVLASIAAARDALSIDFVRQVALAHAAPYLSAGGKEAKPYVLAVLSALDPRVSAVSALCRAAEEDPEDAGSPAGPIVLTDLQEVANSGLSPIAASAVAALLLAGIEMGTAADTILASDVESDRLVVTTALAARPSGNSRLHLRRALSDKHFRCRANAAIALAPEASSEERRAIIALGSDPSGPVRVECARIIGEGQWPEGKRRLFSMIRDRQNADSDAMTVYAAPVYRVARVAAQALFEFGHLDVDEVDELIRFINQGKAASDDIEVHRNVIRLLQKTPSEKAVQTLVTQLGSMWRMEGTKNSGYPLRYASAYGLAAAFSRDAPGTDADSALEALTLAAQHSDERLAAPALMALGLGGNRGATYFATLLHHEETTHARGVLFVASYARKTDEMPEAALFDTLTRAPGWSSIAFALKHPSASNTEWEAFIDAHDDERIFVEALSVPSQTHAALRHVLKKMMPQVTAISSSDFRETELAEKVSMFTFHAPW